MRLVQYTVFIFNYESDIREIASKTLDLPLPSAGCRPRRRGGCSRKVVPAVPARRPGRCCTSLSLLNDGFFTFRWYQRRFTTTDKIYTCFAQPLCHQAKHRRVARLYMWKRTNLRINDIIVAVFVVSLTSCTPLAHNFIYMLDIFLSCLYFIGLLHLYNLHVILTWL